MSRPTFDPRELFECLSRHDVDFIVIGGQAAIAHGVGWPTYDADVVIDVVMSNLQCLLDALKELDAEYDTPHQPPIRPDLERLSTLTGPQLFRTKFGRLDILKDAGGETFSSLCSDAVAAADSGLQIRSASIPALIRMKKAANRPKDQEAIARLEAAMKTTAPG